MAASERGADVSTERMFGAIWVILYALLTATVVGLDKWAMSFKASE